MMSAYNLGMLAEGRGDREAGIKYLNEAATAAEVIQDTSALERIESAKQKIIDDRSAL